MKRYDIHSNARASSSLAGRAMDMNASFIRFLNSLILHGGDYGDFNQYEVNATYSASFRSILMIPSAS